MKVLELKISVLLAFLLLLSRAIGDRIDEICAKWSANEEYVDFPPEPDFTVGYENTTICYSEYSQFKMDHGTCFGYFNCYSMESVGIWNQCPSGTHFNPNANQCVSPATYQCPYNRCNNQNRPNMVILKTECRKYQVCATGKIQSCPISAPYYDEVNQACTNILPPYAVCAL